MENNIKWYYNTTWDNTNNKIIVNYIINNKLNFNLNGN